VDFSFTDEQQAVAELAGRIFDGRAGPERVGEVERSAERIDRQLWAELARANLLGIPVPVEDGGSGLGVVEWALILEAQGRCVAPVPLLWHTVAALTVAGFGTGAQRARWLPGAVDGTRWLTAGLAGPGAGDPRVPALTATPAGEGFVLRGTSFAVPAAHVADAVLVAARVGDETSPVGDDGAGPVIVALVDPAGLPAARAEATDRQLLTHLCLDGVEVGPDELVAGPERGAAALRHAVERALVGLAALQVGVAEAALARAASYTSGRVQFGRPLSSFQSTAARAADAYIDTEAMRAVTLQAAWRLDLGLEAAAEVAVAKWWAAEAGQRVVHTAQHLHGGLGADVSYPIHRYFLWGKQIEDTLGGASAQLAQLGRLLAAEAR